MIKLKMLQQKQAAAKQEGSNGPAPSAGATAVPGTAPVQRQSSQDLTDLRRQKSKESFFSLKTSQTSVTSKRANAAELRAQKDIAEMFVPTGCKVDFPNLDDIMNFKVSICPNDGLYQGATFNFSVAVPPTYPYDPPKVHCDTLVYHPNIDYEGHVCLNILRQEWMPVLNLGSVIFGLMTLFLEPNPGDPLNEDAAKTMDTNRRQFEQNIKQTLKGGFVLGRHFPKLL